MPDQKGEVIHAHPLVGAKVFITCCDIKRDSGGIKLGAVDKCFVSRHEAREYVLKTYKFNLNGNREDALPVVKLEQADRFITEIMVE